jgi:phosphate transport system protein
MAYTAKIATAKEKPAAGVGVETGLTLRYAIARSPVDSAASGGDPGTMAAERRSFRSNLRVDIVGIARAAWKQLTSAHVQRPRVRQQPCHAEVGSLIGDLVTIIRLVGQMMTNASVALHHADLKLAELVISDAGEMKARCEHADQRCLDLLVVRASVATDLRMVVAAMHMVRNLQRMCNLAQQIAEVARLKHPREPIPADVRPVSVQMSVLASSLAEDAAAAIESRDPMSAARLAQVDDEVDALRRRIFQILFSEDWSHGVEPAVDAVLIGRYYERFADHAVAIARQVNFVVTSPTTPAVMRLRT